MQDQNDQDNQQPKSVVDELRGYLLDEIKKLRDGTTTAASSNAITNAAGKYFHSIKLELEVCHITGRTPRADILGVSMSALPEPPQERGKKGK